MKTFVWKDLSAAERKTALSRPENRRDPRVLERVREIFDDVEARGFAGLTDWAVKLDGHAPDAVCLDAKTVDAARAQLTSEDLAAMELAVENVRAFRRHAPGVIDGDGGVEELAAIGEGVRRDVENAHHGGPAEGE